MELFFFFFFHTHYHDIDFQTVGVRRSRDTLMTFIAAGDRDGTPYDRCPPGLRGSDNLIADSVSSVHTFPRKKKKGKRKEE